MALATADSLAPLPSHIQYVNVQVPEALEPLLAKARYKAAWGGRAGAKSHFFAEQIVVRAGGECLRVACIREVQNSLKESVRQLIIDKINKHDPHHLEWEVLESEIRNRVTGSLIIFRGMQAYNADNIKSLEGFDIVWVEEAQTLSSRSLRILRPTVRKAGSELWFSWNPRHESDAVDQFFRGQEPPPDAVVVACSYRDNPWLSDEIVREIRHDYRTDPDMFHHVWEGGYEIITEGAYYAKHVAAAEAEGRVGHFPYDPRYRLRTAWDIGVDDYTAIWFIQDDGRRAWVVDFWETSGDGPQQIVPAALPELVKDKALREAGLFELGREKAFKYDRHFQPHDVMVREWGNGAKERWRTLKGLGVWPMSRGVANGPEERINAVRTLLPIMHFNTTGAAGKRVMKGLSRLRRYSRKFNEQMQVWEGPKKDINCHAADAFGEYAINCGIKPPKEEAPAKRGTPKMEYTATRLPDGRVKVTSNQSIMEMVEAKLAARRGGRK